MEEQGKHIKFRLRTNEFGGDGRRVHSTVHSLGGTLPAVDGRYQKYMMDVVAHALTLTGSTIEEDWLMCSDMGVLESSEGNYFKVKR